MGYRRFGIRNEETKALIATYHERGDAERVEAEMGKEYHRVEMVDLWITRSEAIDRLFEPMYESARDDVGEIVMTGWKGLAEMSNRELTQLFEDITGEEGFKVVGSKRKPTNKRGKK